jgi:hypothetical protein
LTLWRSSASAWRNRWSMRWLVTPCNAASSFELRAGWPIPQRIFTSRARSGSRLWILASSSAR